MICQAKEWWLGNLALASSQKQKMSTEASFDGQHTLNLPNAHYEHKDAPAFPDWKPKDEKGREVPHTSVDVQRTCIQKPPASDLNTVSAGTLATALAPSEGMFHLFISYRAVDRDSEWVSKLYDTLCLEVTSSMRQGKRIPLIEKTRFPKKFHCDAFGQQNILNIFWDKACLADGHPWQGDGSKKGGGFIGAILQSVLFTPVLSSYADQNEQKRGSVSQMLQGSDDTQDNVLVEFIVAKFLYECSRNAADSSLLPCSIILPLVKDEQVFGDSAKLNASITIKTNTTAFNVLKLAGYDPPIEMKNSEYVDPITKVHPWSAFSVVKFFLGFQGVLTWKCGDGNRDVKECSQRIMVSIINKLSMCKSLTMQLESNNPLAHELRELIDSKFMGHYLCCLDSHGVKSIRMLSQLDDDCVKQISAEMAQSMNCSNVEQLCKLKNLVLDAKNAKEAQPLGVRLESFFDQNASWSTALTSTCAVDLLMRRQFYLFIMIVAPLIMTAVSIFLLLVPTTYTRVFSNSTEPQSYTDFNIGTIALLMTAAIGLGPICSFCSYAGSPRKGRYALAFTYLSCFIMQNVGFYLDQAMVQYCRFNSLEPTDASIQSCVYAYATELVIRDLFFFGLFLVTLKRQEYYWDGFCLGFCLVLVWNFVIFRFFISHFSITKVIIITLVIALVLTLNTLVRYKRRRSLSEAREVIAADSKQYQVAWDTIQAAAGQTIMTNADSDCSLIKIWRDSKLNPVEVSGTKLQIRQECTDFEFLYFLAEFVNGPFNDMVSMWCTGSDHGGQMDSKQFFNQGDLFKNKPKVIRGPIKSVQRSIEKVQSKSTGKYYVCLISLFSHGVEGISLLQK